MHCNIQMFSRRMWRFQRPCRQERRPTCCTPSPAAGEPTHVAGHTLDLVITTADIVIADLCVGGIISDHALLYFKLCMKKKIETVCKVSRTAWRRSDHEAFASDLAASTLCCNLSSLSCVLSADDLVDMYNRVMTELLDRHCPSVTVQCRQRPSTLWFNAECRAARCRARVLERRFRSNFSDDDRRDWSDELKRMQMLYENKNTMYWQDEIAASNGNMRRLWRTLKGVLSDHGGEDVSVNTPHDFATFFKDKVESVHLSTSTTPSYDVPHRMVPTLDEWTAVSVDEVDKLLGSALCKTCQLDPAPTWLVKELQVAWFSTV